MASSSSKGSRGGSKDSADWRSNRYFLPLWHERPRCKCGRPGIIDVWEFDGTDRWGGITSSVPILTRILRYGNPMPVLNFFTSLYLLTFM
jgi:hypothetical protein